MFFVPLLLCRDYPKCLITVFSIVFGAVPRSVCLYYCFFAASIALLLYQVSPLRDPNFTYSNAGATVDWLPPEDSWPGLAVFFAGAVATNLVFLVRFWLLPQDATVQAIHKYPARTQPKASRQLALWLILSVFWIILFCAIYYGIMLFLLAQWIID